MIHVIWQNMLNATQYVYICTQSLWSHGSNGAIEWDVHSRIKRILTISMMMELKKEWPQVGFEPGPPASQYKRCHRAALKHISSLRWMNMNQHKQKLNQCYSHYSITPKINVTSNHGTSFSFFAVIVNEENKGLNVVQIICINGSQMNNKQSWRKIFSLENKMDWVWDKSLYQSRVSWENCEYW